MKKTPDSPRTPPPSTTRSNSDRVMIVLGIALIVLFVAAGYDALTGPENRARSKPRGPVKDPDRVGSVRDGLGFRASTEIVSGIEISRKDRLLTAASREGSVHPKASPLAGEGRVRGAQKQNPPDGLTGMSMPFPEGFRQNEQFTIAHSRSKRRHDTRGQWSGFRAL